jgi:hypothetical protein
MVGEANKQGLVFDEELLSRYVASGSSPVRHDPSKPMYRLLDLVIRTKILLRQRPGTSFLGRQRRLDRADCLSVRIAEAAADHFRDDSPPVGTAPGEPDATQYRPRNLVHLSEVTHDFSESVEPTIKLPEASWTDVVARLAMRGIALATPGTPDPTAESPAPAGGQSFPAARKPTTESQKVT